MIYLQYFLKVISAKFRNITRLIRGLDSYPQWSRQAVSTYLSGLGQYLRSDGVATNQVVEV